MVPLELNIDPNLSFTLSRSTLGNHVWEHPDVGLHFSVEPSALIFNRNMRIVILLAINVYYQSAVAEDIPAGHTENSENWALNVMSSEIGEEVLKLFSILPLLS